MKSIAMALAVLVIGSVSYGATIEIKMKNSGKDGVMAFEPGFVKAQVGDTVVFVPTDRTHNSASHAVPEGANTWKGKMDQKITVELNKEGVYVYKCDPHLPMGMAGVIQVGSDLSNLEDAKAKAAALSKTFAMNKDRLTKYMEQVK